MNMPWAKLFVHLFIHLFTYSFLSSKFTESYLLCSQLHPKGCEGTKSYNLFIEHQLYHRHYSKYFILVQSFDS